MYWDGNAARSILGLSGFCPLHKWVKDERQQINSTVA
jgi:hypothetical protein